MKITILIALSIFSIALEKANSFILNPLKGTESYSPLAIVMIHGMECKPEAYMTLAL